MAKFILKKWQINLGGHMAGFSIVIMVLFMSIVTLVTVTAIYMTTVLSLLYLIICITKITKLKIKDNELRERIIALKTKSL